MNKILLLSFTIFSMFFAYGQKRDKRSFFVKNNSDTVYTKMRVTNLRTISGPSYANPSLEYKNRHNNKWTKISNDSLKEFNMLQSGITYGTMNTSASKFMVVKDLALYHKELTGVYEIKVKHCYLGLHNEGVINQYIYFVQPADITEHKALLFIFEKNGKYYQPHPKNKNKQELLDLIKDNKELYNKYKDKRIISRREWNRVMTKYNDQYKDSYNGW